MKNFIWHLQCKWRSRRRRTEQEAYDNDWFSYLVREDIKSFLNRFKFWKKEIENDLPF